MLDPKCSRRALVALLLLALVPASAGLADDSKAPAGPWRVGGGIGIPYGILGAGVEFSPTPYVALNGGLGIPGALVATGGARLFPLGRAAAFRPRLSVSGVWLVAAYDYGALEESFVAYGAGFEWGLGPRQSFDVDLQFMNIDGKTILFPTIGFGVHF